jgi:hypothetical protein
VAEIRAQLAPDTPVEVWFQMLWGRAEQILRQPESSDGAATMQSIDNVKRHVSAVTASINFHDRFLEFRKSRWMIAGSPIRLIGDLNPAYVSLGSDSDIP